MAQSTAIPPSTSTHAILSKLEAALNSDGDFPVRAKVVGELRKLVNDPNTPIERIVEVILSEPSLGTRILHLVNSVMYKRSTPVITVSQAVVQVGMRALSDLCSGLVLMQRFSPAAQKGGVFADNVKKCIITSLLSSRLAEHCGAEEDSERGYLAGTFFSIGPLLLAYYFPQVFEAAEKRAQSRGQTTTQSITETIGIAPVGLSLGIVDALSIPQYYRDLLVAAYSIFVDEQYANTSEQLSQMGSCLATAARLADAIIDTHSKADLTKAVNAIAERSDLSPDELKSVLERIPQVYQVHTKMIEMTFLTLPEHFLSFLDSSEEAEAATAAATPAIGDDFSYYLDEIREAIANQETMSSIITSAMEALAFGQKFDRVLLLFSDPNSEKLFGKMGLGQSFGVEAKQIQRDMNSPEAEDAPDIRAFKEGTVELFGDPIFQDGWPFAAVPIGGADRALGVIYVDRLPKDGRPPEALDSGAQVALTMLAELLDEAVTINS